MVMLRSFPVHVLVRLWVSYVHNCYLPVGLYYFTLLLDAKTSVLHICHRFVINVRHAFLFNGLEDYAPF